MLTTREVEQLVQLNRVTIYRLIREENFPAVKIGGQWRFPEEQVQDWLAAHGGAIQRAQTPDNNLPDADRLFNSVEIVSLLDAFAQSVQLSAFVVDPRGKVVVQCRTYQHPFCQFMQALPQGRNTCRANFHQPLAADREPQLRACANGLKYLQSPVIFQESILAYVLMGPILTSENVDPQQLAAFATASGIDRETVCRSFAEVQRFSAGQIQLLVDLLSQVMHTMLEIVSNRLDMAARIREIAQMVADH